MYLIYFTCIDKKKNKNVPFFPLPTESSQMESSFVRIFLLLSFSMTTYSVPHTFSVDISSSVQTKKKRQLTPAFSPLLLLAKVANECFECTKKVIRVY